MKKILALILTLCMMLCFVGCGTSDAPTTDTTISEITPPEKEAPTFIENVVVNENGVVFAITSAPYEDDIWGASIKVRLENSTDKTLMYSLENVSVNGYMVNTLFATEVAPNKKDNTSITIFTSDLEDNGITQIDNIEFTLRVYDTNDWMADPIINDRAFTINFN